MRLSGSSAIFYVFISISLFIVLVMIPVPYYNHVTKSWFPGISLFQRITNGEKVQGSLPLDEVVVKIANSTITSPLDLNCEGDADCKQYLVSNQCKVYCGNQASTNNQAVSQLNNRRICDPSMYKAPKLQCVCIAAKCIAL